MNFLCLNELFKKCFHWNSKIFSVYCVYCVENWRRDNLWHTELLGDWIISIQRQRWVLCHSLTKFAVDVWCLTVFQVEFILQWKYLWKRTSWAQLASLDIATPSASSTTSITTFSIETRRTNETSKLAWASVLLVAALIISKLFILWTNERFPQGSISFPGRS